MLILALIAVFCLGFLLAWNVNAFVSAGRATTGTAILAVVESVITGLSTAILFYFFT